MLLDKTIQEVPYHFELLEFNKVLEAIFLLVLNNESIDLALKA